MLLGRDDDHGDQIDQQAWDSAGDEEDKEEQAEPERAYAEKFSQPATDTRDDAVTARTSQGVSSCHIHFFLPFLNEYTGKTQKRYTVSQRSLASKTFWLYAYSKVRKP